MVPLFTVPARGSVRRSCAARSAIPGQATTNLMHRDPVGNPGGHTESVAVAVPSGSGVGESVGVAIGDGEGTTVGAMVGVGVGVGLGVGVGVGVGVDDSAEVGKGVALGTGVGSAVVQASNTTPRAKNAAQIGIRRIVNIIYSWGP